MIKMNEEDFITKFYSCDNEEQFLKDICHNLNCLQKVQNNWNELKKWLEEAIEDINKLECPDSYDIIEKVTLKNIVKKAQELEQGKDE